MPRVKRGTMTHKRHKKTLLRAKGYWGGRSRLFKTAKEAVMHSFQYAYRDRRNKKRDIRRLWITRISIACRLNGITYSRFIEGLNKTGNEMDRKVMADLAVREAAAFTALVESVKSQMAVA